MKSRILIAEDEAIIAQSLKLCLEELGYSVLKTVSSGEDAVRSAATHNPDLILMDIRLRGPMNGYEAVTQIRRHSASPVIYLTGDDQDEIDAQAKDTRPYDYLIKPFSPDALADKIKKMCVPREDSFSGVPAESGK